MEKPRPTVNSINAPHFDGLSEGRLMVQRCALCREFVYYPRVTCPECLSSELGWVEVSGEGTLASYAAVHKPQHPAFDEETPILLAAVQLVEGPVIFGSLVGGASAAALGSNVELDVAATKERRDLPLFRIVGGRSGDQ